MSERSGSQLQKIVCSNNVAFINEQNKLFRIFKQHITVICGMTIKHKSE